MSGFDTMQSLTEGKHVHCGQCGTEIRLHVSAQTRFVGCRHCQAYYEWKNDNLRPIQRKTASKHKQLESILQIGQKVTLKGEKYLVTGYIVKKEQKEDVYWREYYLFNPVRGYAFLAEYNGHWLLLKTTSDHPRFGKRFFKTFSLADTEYQVYHKYNAVVTQASGEFYYDVTEVVDCTEYVAPPYMLTREIRNKELRWFKGEYLHPADIAQAFEADKALPSRIGVGACQPNPIRESYNQTIIISLLAAVLLLVLQTLLSGSVKEQVVLRESYSISDSVNAEGYAIPYNKTIVTPTFTLSDGTRNLEIGLYSAVDNNWFEAEMTLINEKTGGEQDLNLGVEYYHGYEDGSTWSEGSTVTTEVLSAIPEGNYHLVIVPAKPTISASFDITVRRDISTWFNFWIMLLVLAIFPAIQYWRKNNFEHRRWMNSDYSPYDE